MQSHWSREAAPRPPRPATPRCQRDTRDPWGRAARPGLNDPWPGLSRLSDPTAAWRPGRTGQVAVVLLLLVLNVAAHLASCPFPTWRSIRRNMNLYSPLRHRLAHPESRQGGSLAESRVKNCSISDRDALRGTAGGSPAGTAILALRRARQARPGPEGPEWLMGHLSASRRVPDESPPGRMPSQLEPFRMG